MIGIAYYSNNDTHIMYSSVFYYIYQLVIFANINSSVIIILCPLFAQIVMIGRGFYQKMAIVAVANGFLRRERVLELQKLRCQVRGFL